MVWISLFFIICLFIITIKFLIFGPKHLNIWQVDKVPFFSGHRCQRPEESDQDLEGHLPRLSQLREDSRNLRQNDSKN